jgi:hypothetical protein
VKRLLFGALALVVLGACFAGTQNVTESGEGFPELALEFPATAAPGATATAELTVTNPGPGDMESLAVSFSRLGDPELPPPIVDVVARNGEGTVKEVRPQPTAISPDGVVYTFDGLPEGESVTIEFDLVVPSVDGPAGNAILVSDGQDPERARGVRLETEVGG